MISIATPLAVAQRILVAIIGQRDFNSHLQGYLDDGYEIISDGPSGVQLRGPKVMKTQTKVALVIGAVLVLAWGLGLIIVLFALIDYAMTKQPTAFLRRD